MSYNYAPLAATATRLLAQFGQTATHVETVRGTPVTTVTTEGVAVQIDITDSDRSRAAMGDTPMPTHRFLVSAAITPVLGARLTVGDADGVVMQTDAIQPGATVLAHDVLLRAG